MNLPANPSKAFIAANPHLYLQTVCPKASDDIPPEAKDMDNSKLKPAAKALSAAKRKAERERLEKKFARLWESIDWAIAFNQQYRFDETRQWRFDFAWPGYLVAVEIDGGIWSGGRHTRGKGFENDCEKFNEALLLGWRVFHLTPAMITPEWVQRIAEFITKETK